MKNLLSNLSALTVLLSFVLLIIAFIVDGQTIGLIAGLGIVTGITCNVVLNSFNVLKS